MKVDQAARPLSPKTLSIFVGLTLKLTSLCNSQLTKLKSSGRFCLILIKICVDSLQKFVLVRQGHIGTYIFMVLCLSGEAAKIKPLKSLYLATFGGHELPLLLRKST